MSLNSHLTLCKQSQIKAALNTNATKVETLVFLNPLLSSIPTCIK